MGSDATVKTKMEKLVEETGADELIVTPFSVAALIQYLAAHIRLPRPLA